MPDKTDLIPGETKPFFPEGSTTMLTVHIGMGLFFIMGYFLLSTNIETIKSIILFYYLAFNVSFLFFYYQHLQIRRVFITWLIIAFIQMFFYIINMRSELWAKWSVHNVLSTLVGLPVVLVLYQWFRRNSLQREHKELTIGVSGKHVMSRWDKAATYVIPIVTILLCLF